ncbi:MAG: hypothetical protein LBE71_05310 [Dysgonamonadaceae bacterium]|nr:hypothetical protein [Dysgonamonadaceae bacterium]
MTQWGFLDCRAAIAARNDEVRVFLDCHAAIAARNDVCVAMTGIRLWI